MSNPVKVGITGGIGSGKSTICKIFKILGVPIYDADSRARWLMENDHALTAQITDLFGEESYSNGVLNRSYLAAEVFSNKNQVQKINNLVHPAVGKDFTNWVHEQSSEYVIKEAALLVESGSYKELDYLIQVSAPIDVRIQRVLARDPHRSKADVEKIINQQLTDSDKEKLADHIIRNDDMNMVIPEVMLIHEKLTKK